MGTTMAKTRKIVNRTRETVTLTILAETREAVRAVADKEDRSFSRQCAVLLQEALRHRAAQQEGR